MHADELKRVATEIDEPVLAADLVEVQHAGPDGGDLFLDRPFRENETLGDLGAGFHRLGHPGSDGPGGAQFAGDGGHVIGVGDRLSGDDRLRPGGDGRRHQRALARGGGGDDP